MHPELADLIGLLKSGDSLTARADSAIRKLSSLRLCYVPLSALAARRRQLSEIAAEQVIGRSTSVGLALAGAFPDCVCPALWPGSHTP